ncbi:MAG: tRNA pseudouridine(55) synthase TruB, partial [Firmicutes bacterium]|nr:tRNA pseudouridine(55) synthase TruB [Bacillota bacterium]
MIREGIINVNKPAGMSSHDIVNIVRRLTGVKRIGHTGTLDPQATGVLPVCIGTASRITEYLDLDMKTYLCSMYLGVTSDTLDIWGKEVTDKRENLRATAPDAGRICEAFVDFKGVITQVPPKFSAVWVNGRRLYDYARSGQEVEIPKRTIYIENLDVLDINMEELKVTFRVVCSKGTYIRSICADVGEKLGCGAAMCELTREASGAFDVKDAVSMDYLNELWERRKAALEKLAPKNKHPRGRMNDADILRGGIRVLAKLYGVEALEPALEAEFDEIDMLVNKIIENPDEKLLAFGKAKVLTNEKVEYFIGGGHIRMEEVEILEAPRYGDREFPLPMREEFKHAYRLYAPGGTFLGVAF